MNAAAPTRAAPAPKSEPKAAPFGGGVAAVEPAGLGNLLEQLRAGGLRASLAVGGAGDPEENAADRFADAVMGGSRAPCACGGTCSACGGSGGEATLRRKADGGAAATATIGRAFHGPGRNLDLATRARFEPRTGLDLSRVRLHTDPSTAATARAIGARAYTVGNNIGFAQGAFDPGSRAGQRLIAHELGHVALGHGGVRRVEDSDLAMKYEDRQKQEEEERAQAAKHKAWSEAVDKKWGSQLGAQSKSLGEERDRLNMGLTSVQAKAFDMAGEDGSWLRNRLTEAGYAGPSVADVKQMWARALVSADALKLGSQAKPKDQPAAPPGVVPPELKLEAMTSIPAYYEAAKTFGLAVETALKNWADGVNASAQAQYHTALDNHNRSASVDRETCKSVAGEPGARAFCGGLAIARGSPPAPPTLVVIPPPVSTSTEKNLARVNSAQTPGEWGQVASDLHASAMALGRLMVTSLSSSNKTQKAVQDEAQAIEALDARLAKLDAENAVYKRIPAVFYPKDAGTTMKGADGTEFFVPDMIPWQFYLVHRVKLDDSNGMCKQAGEWELVDLTNHKVASNKTPSSVADAGKLANGEWVDPPVGLFTPLNSKLRFPEGELYFMMPSGQTYVHHMTEPWELSDYLAAAAMFLAAAALVASVVMTAGAATPFALGAGSALLGIGATAAELHEKSKHGLLTDADVNRAMFDIGMNVINLASMGLGRVVTAPAAAARFGSKFGTMVGTLRLLRYTALAADLVQVTLVATDVVQGFQAINSNPNLDDDTRRKMIAQLASRAMVSGALMVVTLKGDIKDIRETGTLHIADFDADGKPKLGAPESGEAAVPKPHLDADAPAVSGKVAPDVHANAGKDGTGFKIGSEVHATSVAGHGPNRDLYFCSDFCVTMTTRLSLVVEALKDSKAHKNLHEPCADMLKKARQIREDLRTGKISEAKANEEAKKIADRLSAISADTTDGHVLRGLLNANPDALENSMADIRAGLKAKDSSIADVLDEATRRTEAMRGEQLKDVFKKPTVSVQERGEGKATFGDNEDLPDYSPRKSTPYFQGSEGIPPDKGAEMAGTVRKLFDLPPQPGGEGTKNVAFAEAFIDGKSTLLGTVSGSEVRPGMVKLPDKTQFRVIDSGFQTRAEDTERKLLEHLADRLPPNATGTIRLYTERSACRSCAGVIQQFEQRFPGIKVIVSFGG